MTNAQDNNPLNDVVPILIGLCAASTKDKPGQQAHYNAIFSVLENAVKTTPALAAEWLCALHLAAPAARPALVMSLLQKSFAEQAKRSPDEALISCAKIMSKVSVGSSINDCVENAFKRSFEKMLKHSPAEIPIHKTINNALQQIGDSRAHLLDAHIEGRLRETPFCDAPQPD